MMIPEVIYCLLHSALSASCVAHLCTDGVDIWKREDTGLSTCANVNEAERRVGVDVVWLQSLLPLELALTLCLAHSLSCPVPVLVLPACKGTCIATFVCPVLMTCERVTVLFSLDMGLTATGDH
jgi:hypothetical protein